MGIHGQVAYHHGNSHEGRQKNLHFWSVRSKYTKSSSLALLILAPCFVFLLIPADLDPGYLWRSWSLHLPEQLRFHVLYLRIYLGYSIFSSLALSLYSIISSILAWKPHGQRSSLVHSPRGRKASDMTGTTYHKFCIYICWTWIDFCVYLE